MAFQDFSELGISNGIISPLRASFMRASGADFSNYVSGLCEESRFRRNISLKENYTSYECWLAPDRTKGFAIGPDRELTNVFSKVRSTGGGDDIMQFVKSQYDYLHLNCFAGPLEKFYARHGFVTTRREKNWAGEHHPAIVYMKLEQ